MVELRGRIASEHRIRIRPNRSLTDRQLLTVVGTLSLACFGIAAVSAINGFWMPLPFAGAEVAALVAATLWVRRGLQQVETIRVGPRDFLFTRRSITSHRSERFRTGWVKIELRAGCHRWYPRRLIVCCKGRELEIGAFLAEQERFALATTLKQLLRPHTVWTMP